MAEPFGQPATETDTPCPVWVKSSASGSGGEDKDCVEVATTAGRVLLRDSKNPGAQLSLPCAAWRAFLDCHS
ncbi:MULTISPECIES: DUF397 domain-containing protein [Amycolatopsis]|uniref:DUF397 domain-containing protein n=1 Tax=Amycolatopsis TaxID=1813 RepID=UPI00174A446C|nr:DUF397 domain-containing protein [Amycolatopsis bullii]